MILLSVILLERLFSLQIINGEEYQKNYTLKIKREKVLPSTRGNIYDRNGELLAYNELAYSVTIEDNGSYDSLKEKNQSINEEIASVLKVLDKNHDVIQNDFNIALNADGTYAFTVEGKTLLRFLADVYGHNKTDELKYNKKLGYNEAEGDTGSGHFLSLQGKGICVIRGYLRKGRSVPHPGHPLCNVGKQLSEIHRDNNRNGCER